MGFVLTGDASEGTIPVAVFEEMVMYGSVGEVASFDMTGERTLGRVLD